MVPQKSRRSQSASIEVLNSVLWLNVELGYSVWPHAVSAISIAAKARAGAAWRRRSIDIVNGGLGEGRDDGRGAPLAPNFTSPTKLAQSSVVGKPSGSGVRKALTVFTT